MPSNSIYVLFLFQGAEVKVHGSVYDEAKKLAVELGSQPGECFSLKSYLLLTLAGLNEIHFKF